MIKHREIQSRKYRRPWGSLTNSTFGCPHITFSRSFKKGFLVPQKRRGRQEQGFMGNWDAVTALSREEMRISCCKHRFVPCAHKLKPNTVVGDELQCLLDGTVYNKWGKQNRKNTHLESVCVLKMCSVFSAVKASSIVLWMITVCSHYSPNNHDRIQSPPVTSCSHSSIVTAFFIAVATLQTTEQHAETQCTVTHALGNNILVFSVVW
jgi:hypothetical protein